MFCQGEGSHGAGVGRNEEGCGGGERSCSKQKCEKERNHCQREGVSRYRWLVDRDKCSGYERLGPVSQDSPVVCTLLFPISLRSIGLLGILARQFAYLTQVQHSVHGMTEAVVGRNNANAENCLAAPATRRLVTLISHLTSHITTCKSIVQASIKN